MHSDLAPTLTSRRERGSPLGTALHRNSRGLLAVFALTTAVATAVVASTVDFVAAVPYTAVATLDPLTSARLAVEVGLVVGLASTTVATACVVASHPRVRVGRAVPLVLVAPVGFVTGVAAGHAVLPALFALRPAGSVTSLAAVVGPAGVVELALFFPVAVGVGAALPAVSVAAVRAGAVPRYTSTRQRGVVALAFVTVAATHSPPDLTTFGLVALPLFVGFGTGLAWLELG
jgi:Sec-independent protein secretion pathway component TatC